MEIIDERKMRKKQTNKQSWKSTRRGGDKNYSERVRAKWFCCVFKLGFL